MKKLKKSRTALREIAKCKSRWKRPAEKGVTLLQDVVNDGSIFAMAVKCFVFPMAVYDQRGVLEMANDSLLAITGLTDEDIKNRKVNMFHFVSNNLREAAMGVFQRKTTVVNVLGDPRGESIFTGGTVVSCSYKSAVFYPFTESDLIFLGVVVFLNINLQSGNILRAI